MERLWRASPRSSITPRTDAAELPRGKLGTSGPFEHHVGAMNARCGLVDTSRSDCCHPPAEDRWPLDSCGQDSQSGAAGPSDGEQTGNEKTDVELDAIA